MEGVGVKGLTMCFKKKKNFGGPEGKSEKVRTQWGIVRSEAVIQSHPSKSRGAGTSVKTPFQKINIRKASGSTSLWGE